MNFLEVALGKAGLPSAKAMIDRGHASPVSKQCVALRISRGSIYYEAGYMLGDLAALDGGSALRRRLRRYALPRLLVIDEVGYLFCSSRHAGLLELVSRRYEHASTLVASLVDRLIHHAEILSLKGKSYRLKEAEARAAKRRGGRS